MMISLLIGVGIISFLLLYLAFNLDKEHVYLKLLIIFVVVFMLILIPKQTLDFKDSCEAVVDNKTITNETITYEYKEFCIANPNNTTDVFYKIYLWFVGLFGIYVLIYYIKVMLEYFENIKVNGR